ncbi:hypothetical protein ILYODFUR_033261 [Ilyodon furcidens]|uniref:Uncharacterized protein n=1 Tax=Ilyodon furcidens TaxID=33524 RepID=A0ABV0SR73_9TELE
MSSSFPATKSGENLAKPICQNGKKVGILAADLDLLTRRQPRMARPVTRLLLSSRGDSSYHQETCITTAHLDPRPDLLVLPHVKIKGANTVASIPLTSITI